MHVVGLEVLDFGEFAFLFDHGFLFTRASRIFCGDWEVGFGLELDDVGVDGLGQGVEGCGVWHA